MKKIIIALFSCVCCVSLSAQTAEKPVKKDYVYKQKVSPEGIDNYLFSTYYYNGKKTYNLRNLTLSSSSGEVVSLKVNPSGTSFAVLSAKGEKTYVAVYDLWRAKKTLRAGWPLPQTKNCFLMMPVVMYRLIPCQCLLPLKCWSSVKTIIL